MDTINTKQDIRPNSLVTYLEGCYFFCGVLGDDAFCKDALGDARCFDAESFLSRAETFSGTLADLVNLLYRYFSKYKEPGGYELLKIVVWAIDKHAKQSNAKTT